MNEQQLSSVAAMCRVYLVNYGHASRRKRTMEIIKELHELTKPQAPPALGIHVQDGLSAGDKLR